MKLLDVKSFPLKEIIIERNFWNEPVDSEKLLTNLKNLEPINPTEKIQVPFKDLQQNSHYKEKLKLMIKSVSGYRDIENCFMLFSTHEKSGWYDEL